MALLTKTGIKKLLNRLWETGGLSVDMEADIKRLQDDFDEREGMLKRYGEVYDGEDRDEYDFVESPREPEGEDWKGKYEEMKQRYVSRFFNGERDRSNGDADDFETTNSAQEEDVKSDGESKTWDDILYSSDQQKTDKGVNG